MPAVLSDNQLAHPYVPRHWISVLEDLRRFASLEHTLRVLDRPISQAEQAELVRQHDSLVENSAALLEPEVLSDLSLQSRGTILLRSVLAVIQLKHTTLADQPYLDTAGSRTLALFDADYFGSSEDTAELIEHVRSLFELTESDLLEEQKKLAVDFHDAHRKQAIVRALRDEFHLTQGAPGFECGPAELFHAMYPDVPVPPEDVELIVTGTLIFFCLPLTKDSESLTTDRFKQSPEQDQNAVRQFLKTLKRFRQERFANFPAFGFVDSEHIDTSLLHRIAQRAELAIAEIVAELPRVVTILPQSEIDKYLIHDIWGHGWQAGMLHFDDLYEQMSHFAEPLDFPEIGSNDASTPPPLAACFLGTGSDVHLDSSAFRKFAMAEVCRRIPIALSAVVAEMMADVAEYKFLAEHPQLASHLPSSSRLWTYPSMLDLTLVDIPFYFGQATKVFRLWSKQTARNAAWIDQLIARGATREAATAAVQDAINVWLDLEADYFRPELIWSEADGQLRVNAFTRIVLNFTGLHRAILAAYRELDAIPTGRLPVRSFRDLLVIATSVFFEAHPTHNLWRMDEFITLVLVPFCRELAVFYRGTSASAATDHPSSKYPTA